MNKIVVAILVLVLAGTGLYVIVSKNKNVATQPSPSISLQVSADPKLVDTLKQGGSSYSDPNGTYVFLYPSEYKIDTQNNGQFVRIYKTGPTQKGQTEIYDGVIMTFETQNLSGKSLKLWTEDYIKSATGETSDLIKDKEEILINNQPAYSFILRGLGEHQYYSVSKTNSEHVIVTASNVSDPGNLGFQEEVNAILTTLEILR